MPCNRASVRNVAGTLVMKDGKPFLVTGSQAAMINA
jgi:hypothetical protein